MRLGEFIETHLDPILAEWDTFARGIRPDHEMDALALRDHAIDILLATLHDMSATQSPEVRAEKSKGHRKTEASAALDEASKAHAIERLGWGFDVLEVVSEYRALRASVLRLWHASRPAPHETDLDDVTRFNESIDQLVSDAVRNFTERVDQARDMYLAILGHDLRNPLNSISMSAQVLPRVVHDADQARAYTKKITTSVTVMGRMIGDLLDYTRTRLGAGMPVVPKPMDLEAMGREVADEFHVAHPDRDIRFSAEGDQRGEWDRDRLRQAISNLIANAVQHGSDEVPIEVRLSRAGDDVEIEVHNGGEPIPVGELPRIFEPLMRGASAQRPKSNRPGSIGLGLYIAREVAKSHGGRIEVTSTAAAGTNFTIVLPTHAPKGPEPLVKDEAHRIEVSVEKTKSRARLEEPTAVVDAT